MRPIYEWMIQNVPKDSAVYSERDPLNYLYTGRAGFSVAINPIHFYTQDEQAIVDAIRQLGSQLHDYQVKYVLVTPNDFDRYISVKQRLMAEMKSMLSDTSRFEKLIEAGGSAVYRVTGP
jgi:hypothetical protein